VTDRTAKLLDVVDPSRRSVVDFTPLASASDYVRFVAESKEIWVTQPRAQRIEVFQLQLMGIPRPSHTGFIAVPGGPESLIIDHRHSRAFTHLWRGIIVRIRLNDRSIGVRWPNGCERLARDCAG
jgi:hypothetical protein